MTHSLASAVEFLVRRARRAGLIWNAVARWEQGAAHQGEVHFGPASRTNPADVGSDTIFDLASLTKVLSTTVLTAVAVREGTLSWSTTVGSALPDVAKESPLAAVTVAQLATHTSGLPAWHPLYGHSGDPIKCLAEMPIQSPPPSGSEYSCLGFITLGLILERVFGSSLDTAFRRRVSEPLGITNELGYWRQGRFNADRLVGAAASPSVELQLCKGLGIEARWLATSDGRQGRPDDGNARSLGGVSGNAGLFGTARAVATLAREFLPGGGLILSAEMSHDVASLAQRRGWGSRALGWSLPSCSGSSAGPSLSAQSLGHTGFTGTSLWLDRDRDLVLVLLCDRVHPGHHGADLQPLRRRFHTLVSHELQP